MIAIARFDRSRRVAALGATAAVVGVLAGFAVPREQPEPAVVGNGDEGTRSHLAQRDPLSSPPTPAPRAPMARASVPRFVGRASGAPTALDRWRANEATPQDLYNGELRDLRWAPAMEEALRGRFQPERVRAAGVPGLKLSELQCRQTMCLVTFEAPEALTAQLHAAGLDRDLGAIDHYLDQTGRLSALATVIGRSSVEADGAPAERVTGLIAFSDEEIDPAAYPAWVEQQAVTRGKP